MRRLLSILLLAVSAIKAFSTAQFTERIRDNGVCRGLATCLLELDSASFSRLEERIPDGLSSTALWRNYIGCWKIQNDSLFLDSVLVSGHAADKPRYVPVRLDDIYAARRTPSGYFADWVTDTLRIVSGDYVRYEHLGWCSSWEHEEFVSVKGGIVKGRTVYENRVVNPVSQGARRQVVDSLDLGHVPGKIILDVRCEDFDSLGKPTAYKVKVARGCGDSAVDCRVARVIESPEVLSRILPIYYIRGRYQADRWLLPITARP